MISIAEKDGDTSSFISHMLMFPTWLDYILTWVLIYIHVLYMRATLALTILRTYSLLRLTICLVPESPISAKYSHLD